MTISLPLTNQTLPDYRLMVRTNGFGAGTGVADNKAISGSSWITLPLQRRQINQHGFYLKFCERVALPQVGRAAIGYRYGEFDDVTVDSEPPVDLRNAEIRIQVSPAGESAWRTAFWGTIDYVEDSGSPGSYTPRGEKVFHCVDGLFRCKRWPLDRHGYYASAGSNFGISSSWNAFGHPGYNWSEHRDAISSGNHALGGDQWVTPAGVSVDFHTPPGAGTKWTDLEVVEHAMAVCKPPGEPLFRLSGATDLLSGATNSWPVHPGESVLDFVLRMLRRERGRGLVFVDWDDDSGNPDGPLTVKLTVGAQVAYDVNYVTDFDSGATASIAGATTRGTAVAVDLVGDHRCVNRSLELGNPDQFRLEYLETEGEKIEVLATLSYVDGQTPPGAGSNVDGRDLTRGWSEADQAAYVALPEATRREQVWRPVFQLHRFNPGWGGILGDGNGGSGSSADYRCTAAGRVTTPDKARPDEAADPAVVGPLSPLLIKVLSDLPLFESYAYSGATVVRRDNAAETTSPPRRKMQCYIRVASNRYLDPDQTQTGSVHMSVDGDSVWIIHSGDDGAGTRFFSVASPTDLRAAYTYQSLALTVGLQLPHHVRLASGDPNTAARRGKIRVPGAHLWLAHPGAIYDLNSTSFASGGYAPKRGAVGATENLPGLLRDDRAALAQIHALAWAWYGTDFERRSATWALKACGFLPSFEAYSGSTPSGTLSTISYPTIGQVVTTLTANGNAHSLNTPITRVHYDAERSVTTWSSEWHELETK